MAKGLYPTWKGALLDWALSSGVPASLTLRIALCGSDFVFNAAHEVLVDLPGVIYEDFLVPGWTASATGLLDAPDVDLGGLAPNDQFHAIVLYWKWTGGTQLWIYTTESSDQPLPIELVADTMKVKFANQGLLQL